MKKLVLALLSVFSLSVAAQSTLTVTVTDNGAPAHGVNVFYYSSDAKFFANGAAAGPTIENFDYPLFTSGNGVATFNLWNVSAGDTVFYATKDCNGNVIWGASILPSAGASITGTLALSCLPGDCDAIFRTDSFPGGMILVEAYPLMEYSQTSLPTNGQSMWTVNGTSSTGFPAANYDSISFFGAVSPFTLTYSRVDSVCSPITYTYSGNGGGGTVVTCNADFTADTVGASPAGYTMMYRDASTTNGTIINYNWQFGDGTVASGPNAIAPTHTYSSTGNYAICLNITSVLGNDTCTSTFCDSVYVGGSTGGGGTPIMCNAYYMVDTLNSGLFQNQLIIWESSYSNGTILSYSWDFGDGTTINAQYPSHTYANTGVYNVCLTITAVDAQGDSCMSTFCDSIGFDSNGNLVYKGQTGGFTINVIDPATVGLEENLLDESLAMYPNPANEKVTLSWDPALKVENVSVLSLAGQEVLSVSPSEAASLEINDLPRGAYLVRVHAATASKTLRLIVH
ncbi:PKD domain-containing protein [Croceimicrobium sp.]|uniref:PKD domain-containing protein n=1 Tax=Croceimicrobium sp. TaxID=2828340 RepID=UPI003BAD8909